MSSGVPEVIKARMMITSGPKRVTFGYIFFCSRSSCKIFPDFTEEMTFL